MAARPPDGLPWGLRSAPLSWREVGLWRPLLSVLAAVLLSALVAFGLIGLAGLPGGIAEDVWLRRQLLFVLYALMMAPVLGLPVLPVAAPLVLVLAVRGWAGALSAAGLAIALGVPILHLALHGDLTTEDVSVLPNLCIALAIQGLAAWAVFWALMARRAGPRPDARRARTS